MKSLFLDCLTLAASEIANINNNMVYQFKKYSLRARWSLLKGQHIEEKKRQRIWSIPLGERTNYSYFPMKLSRNNASNSNRINESNNYRTKQSFVKHR
ncbi:hypothetical protein Dda_6992 [Drechslerella dactyloides]|uniref:Uncharacterized protein n=1 Tax=Drechslerella dactyloides TaxID=74499 RepID=A0AAD6IU48_DREDA|nr:hypothetical protein Dda_6992 [Drechslerella dactyloides]